LNRVYAYIDGFNLYHSIIELKTPNKNRLKWLDIRALCSLFTKGDLREVYYFSAKFKSADTSKLLRQERFIAATKNCGASVILGKFKRKHLTCKVCGAKYETLEEKESDINIAIAMLQHAFEDKFDEALLLTADTDLVSTIKKIKELFPRKQITALIPPQRWKRANELRQSADRSYEIKPSHLRNSLLPEIIRREGGGAIVMPSEYGESKHE
jgi:uncharacterized LabA/DUF88 family protein